MREAEPGEAPGLDIVRRQAIETGFTDTYERDQFADLVAGVDPNLSNWIERDTILVLVVKSDMTPFAYGVLNKQSGQILGLYAAETYQNEGHASRILDQFHKQARKAGVDELQVDSSLNATTFFEKIGFERVKKLTDPQLDLPLIRMKKTLEDN